MLWSKHSIDSDYVKEEAEYAKNNSVLVPLIIDATDPPFGFSRIQTTDISGWDGSTKDPRWQTVVDSIEAILGDEVRNNLPIELTSFVGREAEVREVAGLLQRRPPFDADRCRRGGQDPDRACTWRPGPSTNIGTACGWSSSAR